MDTGETYCLLPPNQPLAPLLERLFLFDGVRLDWNDEHVPIEDAAAAVLAFAERLGEDAPFVRFTASTVPQTRGGWLYKLEDGAAVLGLSGDTSVDPEVFASVLRDTVPNGRILPGWGEQPPPNTRLEFERCVNLYASRRNQR